MSDETAICPGCGRTVGVVVPLGSSKPHYAQHGAGMGHAKCPRAFTPVDEAAVERDTETET